MVANNTTGTNKIHPGEWDRVNVSRSVICWFSNLARYRIVSTNKQIVWTYKKHCQARMAMTLVASLAFPFCFAFSTWTQKQNTVTGIRSLSKILWLVVGTWWKTKSHTKVSMLPKNSDLLNLLPIKSDFSPSLLMLAVGTSWDMAATTPTPPTS